MGKRALKLKLKSEKLYTDRQWLAYQYLELKKSIPAIAQDIGYDTATIYYWLKKFNLPVRNISEALGLNRQHVFLSRQLLEVLNGLLLGDGHIDHQNRWTSNYHHGTKYKVVLEWLSDKFARYGIEQIGKIYRREEDTLFPGREKKRRTIAFFYCSRHYAELKGLQSKWYRPATEEERKTGRRFFKIVPADLELTPLTCLHWYIGDGYLGKCGKYNNYIILCTHDFTEEEVYLLVSLLKSLGFKANMQKAKSIYLSAKSVPDFLRYIGPCPKRIKNVCNYKWETSVSP